MSRVGKLPIEVPANVTVDIAKNEVAVSGPKGKLKRSFHPNLSVKLENNTLRVSRPDDSKLYRSMHGLTRSLLANMVTGVADGFEKVLEIVGVGYRVEKTGENLVIRAGFSHTVGVTPLPGITLEVDGATRIKVKGIDKEVVGQMAAKIRAIRPPDTYKGKGIRYAGEVVRLKPGKAGKAVGSS